jgi:hypothetical protein
MISHAYPTGIADCAGAPHEEIKFKKKVEDIFSLCVKKKKKK